jgi:hypothetical protein
MDYTKEMLRIFGFKKDEILGGFRKLPVRGCIICTLHQILLWDKIKEYCIYGACNMHERDKNAYNISAGNDQSKILLEAQA